MMIGLTTTSNAGGISAASFASSHARRILLKPCLAAAIMGRSKQASWLRFRTSQPPKHPQRASAVAWRMFPPMRPHFAATKSACRETRNSIFLRCYTTADTSRLDILRRQAPTPSLPSSRRRPDRPRATARAEPRVLNRPNPLRSHLPPPPTRNDTAPTGLDRCSRPVVTHPYRVTPLSFSSWTLSGTRRATLPFDLGARSALEIEALKHVPRCRTSPV